MMGCTLIRMDEVSEGGRVLNPGLEAVLPDTTGVGSLGKESSESTGRVVRRYGGTGAAGSGGRGDRAGRKGIGGDRKSDFDQ